jgi:hypothetical protein
LVSFLPEPTRAQPVRDPKRHFDGSRNRMKIYGLDFTSAPRLKKPITCAECELQPDRLAVLRIATLPSFDDFKRFLPRDGPWVAGIDFPFGQPTKLIDGLGWPICWDAYVAHVSEMSLPDFAECLRQYQAPRPLGDKHHLRTADRIARSRSPMMLFGVPVGRMFFRGAPMLLKAPVSILPCRPYDTDRIVVEAYPKLVAQRWINASYKNGIQAQAKLQRAARQAVLVGLRSEVRDHYGFAVHLSDALADDCIQDGSGDRLDAMLCAVQAAWAHLQRDHNYGIPRDCDRNEGWIVDPWLQSGSQAAISRRSRSLSGPARIERRGGPRHGP